MLDNLRALFAVHLAGAVQFRSGMALWAAASLLQLVVYLSVWSAVARASGGSVAGYTVQGFAGYFLVLLVVREFSFTWLAWEFEYWVQHGSLSPRLLRPLHPVWEFLASIQAYKLQSMLVMFPAVIVLAVVFRPALDTRPTQVLVAIPVLLAAMATRFLADWSFSMLSFWITRIGGLRNAYYFVLLFASGQFAPLDVFPPGLAAVAKALPFYWTLGYPTELLMGRAEPASAIKALLVMGAWIVLLYALSWALWRAGLRRYSAVGA